MLYHDEFYTGPPAYPDDAAGQPMYPPLDPQHPARQRMAVWRDMGANGHRLRSMETKWVYMHPNTGYKPWHLAGPLRGREGVVLARELEGVLQPDFEIRYSSGPYMIGETAERVDYKKRVMNFGSVINPNGNAERDQEPDFWNFHSIMQQWAASWSETVPGFLGCFTRMGGWRFLPVISGEATKTTLSIDPAAHRNNGLTLNQVAHAPWPLYAKKALTRSWKASPDQVGEDGIARGTIPIANRGTFRSYPKYLVRGTGTATVQDGIGGRQITLPRLYEDDGAYMLVDTDPTKRTITTEKEPVDSELYRYMRNAQLLQVLLPDVYGVAHSKLPAQRRIPGGIGFDNAIPPKSVAHLNVSHTNPNGSITCVLPQPYRMPWA